MSQEIGFWSHRLAPLKSRNFRLFFIAQIVSFTGSWMQELAKSWIVINLLGRASALGALLFAAAIPYLILSSFGGSLADRKNVRPILVGTQIALALIAVSIGFLIHKGLATFGVLIVFAIIEGCVIAFDLPAFHKVIPRLIPAGTFQQALALNAISFHLTRVLGPSLAGLMMGLFPVATIFWINAVSFLAIVGVLFMVDLKFKSDSTAEEAKPMGEAVRYVFRHPIIRPVIIQFYALMCLIFPLVFTTIRVMIQSRFNLNARDFGLVFTCPGLGALLGSLTFMLWNPRQPLRALPYGIIGIAVFLALVNESHNLAVTCFTLVFFSYSMFLSISALNVTVQLTLEEKYRGRVSSLTGMAFVSFAPMMSAPLGLLSDHVGDRLLIWIVIGVFLGLAGILAFFERRAQIRTQMTT